MGELPLTSVNHRGLGYFASYKRDMTPSNHILSTLNTQHPVCVCVLPSLFMISVVSEILVSLLFHVVFAEL